MFAILGLRSLYPVLSKAATELKYLEPAVAVILAFIGGKMIAEYFNIVLPTETALGIIVSLLVTGVGASVWERRGKKRRVWTTKIRHRSQPGLHPQSTFSFINTEWLSPEPLIWIAHSLLSS